jgi:nitric oxide reductase subunit C
MRFDTTITGVFATLLIAFLGYSFYLYADLPQENSPASPQVAQGKLLWQQHNCGACHQVYGLGGYLGPDLTNVYSRRGPDFISGFLQAGVNTMPAFHLSEQDKGALLAYLKNLDQSGNADPRQFIPQTYGHIVQR